MAISRRQAAVFASGLVLGAAVIAGLWMLAGPSSSPIPAKSKIAAPSVALVKPPLLTCPQQPVAAVAGEKDARFLLLADLSGNTEPDIASFLVVGKEAAAAGRPRDAEVAFLMSCRVAEKFKGAGSVESADAKYQLAWHYEWLAHDGASAGASRAEYLKRAESLYADSSRAFLAKYGEAHEKSRFAVDGLAAVRQALAQGQTGRQAGPTPAREKPAEAIVAGTTAPAGSAGESGSNPSRAFVPRPQPRKVEPAQSAAAASRPTPSFDCAKARSTPEKIICSDAELARLDRELGRVYARAKSATSDSADFRRQNNDEWRKRESTCGDRECLLRWYARRRNQLMSDINEARGPVSPGVYR